MGPKGFICEPHWQAKGIRIRIMMFKVLCIRSHKEDNMVHVEARIVKCQCSWFWLYYHCK